MPDRETVEVEESGEPKPPKKRGRPPKQAVAVPAVRGEAAERPAPKERSKPPKPEPPEPKPEPEKPDAGLKKRAGVLAQAARFLRGTITGKR